MRGFPGRRLWIVMLCGALGLVRAPAAAQMADASAVTLGLAANATATARGLSALSLNPAGLGMPESGFSFALLPVQLRLGLHPVTLADLADYQGVLLPAAVKQDWLARVSERGSQTGAAGVDVTAFALSAGRVGIQLSTIAFASMSLAPDIVELVLFGNAGRTGTPADLTLGGSELETFAVTTASASAGFPLRLSSGTTAVGVTVKYSVGHAVAAGREQSGSVSSDPLAVHATFPIVATAEDVDGVGNGSGMGVDVGFQVERGRFGLGVSVLNLLHTFAWDEAKLAYRPGTVFLDESGSTTAFEEQPLADAPAPLARVIRDMRFRPIVSVGGAWRARDDLTLSADVRRRLGDGIVRDPEFHAGVGAEWHGLPALVLRGGLAAESGGIQVAGGTSIVLGPVNLSAAGALRRGEEDANLAQFTLSFGGR